MPPSLYGTASVGIDVAEARKGLDLVALDKHGNLVESRGRLAVAEVVSLTTSLQPAVVSIDSPSGWSTSSKSRLAERQLANIGIQSYRTPSDPGDHPFYRWIRVGLEIYEGLSAVYPRYRGGPVDGTAAEIFPHATACVLNGELPPPGTTKEFFRRKALRDQAIAEHTLSTIDRLDAALAALTGLIALGGRHASLGDPDEGVILLPVGAVPVAALRRGALRPGATSSPSPRRVARSRGPQGATVQIGYMNRNQQTVRAATGLPGTDHGQSIYVLRCGHCGLEYGSNGSDNFQRKCPNCQSGAQGLRYT